MKKGWTVFDKDGHIGTSLEAQPVIIIKKGKRKINPLLVELIKNVPEDVMRKIEKSMSCLYLTNGDECSKGLPGTPCDPDGCVAWRKREEGIE